MSILTFLKPREALIDLAGAVFTQMHVKDIVDQDRFWHDQLQHINDGYLSAVRTKPYYRTRLSCAVRLDATDGKDTK